MRTCRTCKKDKPLSEFYKRSDRENRWYSDCKECHGNKRMKIYWKKKEKVDQYKLKQGCQRCGYNEHACALHYHHKEQEDKTACVNELMRQGRKWSIIEKEIEKCEVLCANCHAVEHNKNVL